MEYPVRKEKNILDPVINRDYSHGGETGNSSTLQDDGKGLPPDFNIDRSGGFGLQLVKMLCQQVDGTFVMENHAGTMTTIEFEL